MCTKSYGMKGLSEVWSGSETPLLTKCHAHKVSTLCEHKNGTSSIDDNNTWVEYTNGVVSNKYNGNLLPGTEEFENSSYWEKNGY